MPSKLEPTELSPENLKLIHDCFYGHDSKPTLGTYHSRPQDSVLYATVKDHLMRGLNIDGMLPGTDIEKVIQVAYRSIRRAWDDVSGSSHSHPGKFMRTSLAHPFEIVAIPKKGRGVIATRKIGNDCCILREAPCVVLPPAPDHVFVLLDLPEEALQEIMLLHNKRPDERYFKEDKRSYRLLNKLLGVLITNSSTLTTSYGDIVILLLKGSMFNHSDDPNVKQYWDEDAEQMVFESLREIKEGEELVVNYLPGVKDAERAQLLKDCYGLS